MRVPLCPGFTISMPVTTITAMVILSTFRNQSMQPKYFIENGNPRLMSITTIWEVMVPGYMFLPIVTLSGLMLIL